MSHMTYNELVSCMDSVFLSMIGSSLYADWKDLKVQMKFSTERSFVEWLLQLARSSASEVCEALDNHGHGDVELEAGGGYEEAGINDESYDDGGAGQADEQIYMDDSADSARANNLTMSLMSETPQDGDTTPQQTYQCLYCNQTFSQKTNLKLHHNTVHLHQKDYKCEFCTEIFTSRFDKQQHEQTTHSDSKKFAHSCEFCLRHFFNKQVLKNHVKSVHYKIADHVCKQCDKRFTHHSALCRHVKVMHLKIKPHICPECEKTFSCRRNLEDHMIRIHKNTKRVQQHQELMAEQRQEQQQLQQQQQEHQLMLEQMEKGEGQQGPHQAYPQYGENQGLHYDADSQGYKPDPC